MRIENKGVIRWKGLVFEEFNKNGTMRVMDFSGEIPLDYLKEVGKPPNPNKK